MALSKSNQRFFENKTHHSKALLISFHNQVSFLKSDTISRSVPFWSEKCQKYHDRRWELVQRYSQHLSLVSSSNIRLKKQDRMVYPWTLRSGMTSWEIDLTLTIKLHAWSTCSSFMVLFDLLRSRSCCLHKLRIRPYFHHVTLCWELQFEDLNEMISHTWCKICVRKALKHRWRLPLVVFGVTAQDFLQIRLRCSEKRGRRLFSSSCFWENLKKRKPWPQKRLMAVFIYSSRSL
jgi:hypothetical protein